MSGTVPRSATLVAAVAVLGAAVHLDASSARTASLVALVVAAALTVVSLPGVGPAQSAGGAGLRPVGPAAVIVQCYLLLELVAVGGRATGGSVAIAAAVLLGICLLAADQAREQPATGFVGWGALVALLAALVVVFAVVWVPVNDVLHFQTAAVERLLAGGDPYTPGYYLDLSLPGLAELYYAPEVIGDDGRLLFGFPYMPLALLVAVPFVLLGDVRLLHLAAVALTAGVVWHMAGGGARGRLAVVLLATSPVVVLTVLNGWNDPLVLLLLAGVTAAWQRDRHGTADVLVGLLLATKQYGALLVPVYLLLAARRRDEPVWRPVPRIAVASAVVSLPFLAVSGRDMWFSTVELQFLQPFRPDSLSLLFAASPDVPAWAGALAFVMAAGATVLVARRARADAVGLAVGIATVLFAFLLLSKQAFVNYYVVVAGLLLVGLAAAGSATSAPRARVAAPSDGATTGP